MKPKRIFRLVILFLLSIVFISFLENKRAANANCIYKACKMCCDKTSSAESYGANYIFFEPVSKYLSTSLLK